MGALSKIEWTDHTFNPWVGCTKVSPACDHCYAEGWAKRTGQGRLWTGERRRTSAANWKQPLKWNREAAAAGVRERVFCASLADVFDNQVPEIWRSDLFALIEDTPHLDWLLLTKRPQNIAKMIWPKWDGGLPKNIWLGTTVENQEEADRRIPHLLAVPARVHFLSCEPLLGPVDLSRWLPKKLDHVERFLPLDDEVRADGNKHGQNVGPSLDFPQAHRLPSAPDALVLPADGPADCLMEPVDDFRRRAVDRQAHALGCRGPASPVNISFTVKHPGDVTENSGVLRDSNRLGPDLRPNLSEFNASLNQSTRDRRSAGSDARPNARNGFPGAIGIDDRREPSIVSHGAQSNIDWVIVGGESGPGARPMSIQWARELRDQCAAAGVPFHFKQWGEWRPAGLHRSEEPGRFAFGDYEHDRAHMVQVDHYPRQFTMFGARSVSERVGKKRAGRLLDGREHDDFPAPLSGRA